MPRRSPESVMARSERAWQQKRAWFSLQQECWEYAAPGLNPFRHGDDPWARGDETGGRGQPRHGHLFDSTLARAVERSSNRMVTELFPAGQDWAQMREGPFFGGVDAAPEEAADAIAQTQRRVFQALRASPVLLALAEMALDGWISGTGLMKGGVSADSATLLDWEAVNQAEVALGRGPGGRVWEFYRKARMPLEFVPVYWPGAQGRLPADTQDVSGDVAAPRLWDVVEATYYTPDSGLWYEDVLLRGAGGIAQRISEQDRPICAWIAWRYSLLMGEVQGRSPVMTALPDARTLNTAQRVRLESASVRVAGMYTYLNNSVFNPAVVRPRSGLFLPVGSNNPANPTIRALELSGDPQLGEIVTADHRESVREAVLDFALPDNASAPKTATEISAKQTEARMARGLPYLRMVEEVGRPLLRLAAYLLSEVGQLPELAAMQPPGPDGRPQPLRLDGTDVQVQFTAPAVNVQGMIDAQRVAEWAEISQMAAGPEAWMDGARVEDVPAVLNELMEAPQELVRDDQERADRARQRQEAAMAQAAGPQGAGP